VTICINYLKLQSVNVALQKRVTSLTTQLKDAQMENDTVYNEIIANVDLEKIKEYAMNTLGMTYPAES
jgi:cell division protein FtsL